ncbi:MAG: RNA polymerase sigma factor [Christensenellales bacterium]
MDNKTLNKLLQGIANGDNEAFANFYEITKKGVYAFVSYYLPKEDAEDVMQDVYLLIRANAYKYQPDTNAKAWILQIAKNQSLNKLKKEKRYVPLEAAAEKGVCERYNSVSDVMKKCLSQEEYEIVTLHVVWGYKHKEIAEMISAPTGTVTSKYKRAVDKVKAAIKEV